MYNPDKLAPLSAQGTQNYKDEQQQNGGHHYAQTHTKNTIGHEPSYKQQEEKTNRASFLCGNLFFKEKKRG